MTAEMKALIAVEVDGMFTNFPDRLDVVLGADALTAEEAARHAW